MSSTTPSIRAPMPQVSMVAAAPLPVDDAPIDNEKCTVCDKSGLLTQCDECNEWNHWHCVDPEHQPTSGSAYLCGKCRDATDRHPVPCADLAILHHDCVVCLLRKPATEFVYRTIPACSCNASRPTLCALCAYKMADGADEHNSESKCPTCRQQWHAFVARPTQGAADEVIQLAHARGTEESGAEAGAEAGVAAGEEASAGDFMTEEQLEEWLLNPDSDPPVAAAPPAAPAAPAVRAASAVAAAAAPAAASVASASSSRAAAMAVFNQPPDAMDVDDDDDSDYEGDDLVIGNVNPNALALARSGCGERCSGKAPKPKKIIIKKGPASERAKDVKLNRDKSSFNTSKLKNPKWNPPVRITGSTMRKITDEGRKLSHFDSDPQRNRILRKIFSEYDVDDISDPDQLDANAISAHCRVLAIRDGVPVGAKGDSSAMKYCGYVAKFVSPTGFAFKSEFVTANTVRARGIAKQIGKDIVAQKPSLKTTADKYAKNHMAGFRLYCELLKKERDGTINADPPPDTDDEEDEEDENAEEFEESD